MLAIRWCLLPGLAGLMLLLAAPARPQSAEGKVELKVVNYQGLGETVTGLKGKIVVVDFWQND